MPEVGAILVGGHSSRMGLPKHALRLPDGRTMIEHVAGALQSVCRRVVMVGRGDVMPELPHVDDLRPDCGPLGGLEALLDSGLDSHYLVCPCDVPLINAEVLRLLVKESAAAAVVFRQTNHQESEPLPMRLSVSALPVVRRMLDNGGRAIWSLLGAIHVEIIELPQELEACLQNVNTPADFDEARRLLDGCSEARPLQLRGR